MTVDLLESVHPGEILLEDFLEPLGISQYALAKAIGVPPQRVLTIIHGHRAVTADIKWRWHLSRAASAIQKKSLAVNLTRHGKDCGTLNKRSRKI